MHNILSIFRDNIQMKYQINYPKPSNTDKIMVEKYMIPTFLYEEAQGDAFVRTIMLYQNTNEQKMPIFQKIVENLLDAVNLIINTWDIKNLHSLAYLM